VLKDNEQQEIEEAPTAADSRVIRRSGAEARLRFRFRRWNTINKLRYPRPGGKAARRRGPVARPMVVAGRNIHDRTATRTRKLLKSRFPPKLPESARYAERLDPSSTALIES
jgi:hypothetical protein